jgi:hypothetical protein
MPGERHVGKAALDDDYKSACVSASPQFSIEALASGTDAPSHVAGCLALDEAAHFNYSTADHLDDLAFLGLLGERLSP